MRRDRELMTELLTAIADSEGRYMSFSMMDEKTEEHLYLLEEEGLIEGDFVEAYRVTSKGHDYLEAKEARLFPLNKSKPTSPPPKRK